ncbi:hypothetical protein GCM10009737_18940 [Nocardioides lentus]|uniref:AI-2E family transporter n=1 Tax=Nocardioides lentus TaxID=338077 RepID=A0ABP5AMD0_9ACTN
MTSVGNDLPRGGAAADEVRDAGVDEPGADGPDGPDTAEERRRTAWRRRGREAERGERLAQQFVQQWTAMRAERRAEPAPVRGGETDTRPAEVPWALDVAAAWAWRLLLIAGAGFLVLWLLAYFAVVTLPLAISLLIAALASPLVHLLQRARVPAAVGAAVAVVLGLGFVALLLTFVSRQIAEGAADLGAQVAAGLGQVRDWLKTGPLNASDSQINDWLGQAQSTLTENSQDAQIVARLSEVGAALGHVLAGLFITLFATFFFLADGRRIWSWVVRLAPRAARERFDESGHVAWVSLTQFVRATVVVALVDAIGIMIWAAVLGVPFVAAIGVLVFLGAFVPLIGATVAGSVAVLVALVDQGPVTALLMLLGVIVVQQIEGHILQPFLMGRFVSVHPLGVIVAIGCGVLVAGVAGALIAVPLVAALNAVVQHLAAATPVGGDPEELADDELATPAVEAP